MVGPPPTSWAVAPEGARVYELIEGLWSLRLPLPWDHIPYVNAYLIALEEGVMLVDCGGAGDPSATRMLEAALAQAGFRPEDVRVLVATHTHSDHVGTAEWIIDRSGAAFWMHPDTAHFYDAMRRPQEIRAARERRARDEGVPEALLPVFADVREETEGVIAAREGDHELVAGVRLPSRLGDWEVIETPGHSPSHVGLRQRERRVLIAGDLVSSAFSPYFDYGYSEDPVTEFLASLDRVAALGPFDLVLPGHGRPLQDIDTLVATHRDGVAERLARTREAVAQGPAGAYEITRRSFGDGLDGEDAVWRMTEILAYLRHLRLTGEVVRERDADGTLRHRLVSASVRELHDLGAESDGRDLSSEPGGPWGAAVWEVRAGREGEFVERWRAISEWTVETFSGCSQAKLFQDPEQPTRFLSIAPWTGREAIENWGRHPEAQRLWAAMQEVIESVDRRLYELRIDLNADSRRRPRS